MRRGTNGGAGSCSALYRVPTLLAVIIVAVTEVGTNMFEVSLSQGGDTKIIGGS